MKVSRRWIFKNEECNKKHIHLQMSNEIKIRPVYDALRNALYFLHTTEAANKFGILKNKLCAIPGAFDAIKPMLVTYVSSTCAAGHLSIITKRLDDGKDVKSNVDRDLIRLMTEVVRFTLLENLSVRVDHIENWNGTRQSGDFKYQLQRKSCFNFDIRTCDGGGSVWREIKSTLDQNQEAGFIYGALTRAYDDAKVQEKTDIARVVMQQVFTPIQQTTPTVREWYSMSQAKNTLTCTVHRTNPAKVIPNCDSFIWKDSQDRKG